MRSTPLGAEQVSETPVTSRLRLAISKTLMDAYGGTIHEDRASKPGVRMVVEFPLVPVR